MVAPVNVAAIRNLFNQLLAAKADRVPDRGYKPRQERRDLERMIKGHPDEKIFRKLLEVVDGK